MEKLIGPINYSLKLRSSLDENGEYIDVKISGSENLVKILDSVAVKSDYLERTRSKRRGMSIKYT